MAKLAPRIKLLLDPNHGVASLYDPATMPTTFVIDRKGIVRAIHTGYEPGDEKNIEASIVRLKP